MATETRGSPEVSVERRSLHLPDIEEVAKSLENDLKKNFKHATVTVENCPDLTKQPFGLAREGLGGSPKLLDVGGVSYLIPTPVLSKIYNFDKLANMAGIENAFIIGAGAGGYHIIGVNSEMMANVTVGSSEQLSSKIAMVDKVNGSCKLENFQHKEFCLLGNFLASKGQTSKVLKICASKRTGGKNFVTCIREALASKYLEKPVGLGGVFLIKKGKANLHVMPDFSSTPLKSDSDVEKWLNFYEMNAPLICLSVLISSDPGLDLRVEHTHCFSNHGEGGHYHYDTTPDDVEYEAYYSMAEEIVRIDRPESTHLIGRD